MPRSGWVRGPVGKKGYMVQANTLDAMWRGAAIMSENPVVAGKAAVALTTALTNAIPDAQIITPVAGTMIFGLIQNFFPGIITISTGFGVALLAVGGVSYLIAKWDEDGSLIAKYAAAQRQAWRTWTAVTGASLDEVVEYYQVEDIIDRYSRTGLIRVSRRINPFEEISYHPNQGVDIQPQTGLRNYFSPVTYSLDQDAVPTPIYEPTAITSAGPESNLFIPIQRAMKGFTNFVSVFSSADEVSAESAEEVVLHEEIALPKEPSELSDTEVVDFVFEEIAPSPELVEEIIEELIETHAEIKEIIEKHPPPDYIKPKILSDLKKNTFNKGILAPIGLFILIIFLKRRRKKRK